MKTRAILFALTAGLAALLAGCDEGGVVYEEAVYTVVDVPVEPAYEVVYEAPAEYQLDVVVTDAWGHALPGAWVSLRVADASGYWTGVSADAFGHAVFTVQAYPDTVLSLVVSEPGYADAYEVVITDAATFGIAAAVVLTTAF
jgi:hypothetical protein